MQIDLNVLNAHVAESTTTTNKMRLSEHAQSMIFQMFTKNVYSNPIGTVVREITSNCFDSHVEAGVKHPVLIKLSHDKESDVKYISFIDYGVGMSPERVKNVYSVYFESTKRGNNSEIGGFGIGAKSILAYKRFTGEGDGEYDNSFFVITNHNKTKYYYTVFEGTESPEYTLFHQEYTNERNGTEIRIPVLEKDIKNFANEMKRQLYYFEDIVFEGFDDYYDIIENDYQIIKGNNFLYRGEAVDNKMHVCLGRVYYPIDYNILGLNSSDYGIPVALDVQIGDVNVTVSRESLDYSEQTIKYLKNKLDEVKSELKQMLENQYQNIITLEEFFRLKNAFGILFFTDTKKVNLGKLVSIKDFDFSNFKYNEYVKSIDSEKLYNLFFNVSNFGKREFKTWQSKKHDESYQLEKNYLSISQAPNLYYSENPIYKRTRLKSLFLREKHGRYYVITKKTLSYYSITDVFKLHFDTKDTFYDSKAHQEIQQIQEDYFNIIRTYGHDYDNVQIPDTFKIEKTKNILLDEYKKITIPIEVANSDEKTRVKLKDLYYFKGVVYYSNTQNVRVCKTAHNCYSTLFDSKHLVYSCNQYNTENIWGGRYKSMLFVSISNSNLKYFKIMKNAYPVEEFFNKHFKRKEKEILSFYFHSKINEKYIKINEFYKNNLFGLVSPKWKKKIQNIDLFLENKNKISSFIRNNIQILSKHINFDSVVPTQEEKLIMRDVKKLQKIQEANLNTFEYIKIPYYFNEKKHGILIEMLKKVLILQ